MNPAAVPWAHAVIASRRPLEDRELDDLMTRAEPALPFEVAHRERWCSADGTVGVVAFAGSTAGRPIDPGSPWHVTTTGITVLSGLPVPRSGWWRVGPTWPEQLGDGSADAVSSCLFGTFCVTRLAADGTGSMAGDELGVSVLYRSDGPDRIVVATRPSLALVAAGRSARADMFALGWLLSFDNQMGTGTSFAGVEAMPARTVVDVRPGGRVAVRHRELPQPANGVDAVEVLEADIDGRLRALATAPGPPVVGLTGGHDSRVLLAVACAGGIADRFRWTTWALDESDVAVAGRLAAAAGVGLEVVTTNRPSWPAGVDDLVLRSEAMLPATEAGALVAHDGLVVSGIGGELLGTYFGSQRPVRDRRDVRATFGDRVRRPDGANLLGDEAAARYGAEIDDVIDRLADRYEPSLIPTMVYLDHRLHRWQGTVRECGTRADVAPLLSATALAAAATASHDDRRRHAVHDALIRRSAPQLATLAYATPGTSTAHQDDWAGRISRLAGTFDAPAATRLFEVLDRSRTTTALASPAAAVPHVRRQLVVAHGIARWLERV